MSFFNNLSTLFGGETSSEAKISPKLSRRPARLPYKGANKNHQNNHQSADKKNILPSNAPQLASKKHPEPMRKPLSEVNKPKMVLSVEEMDKMRSEFRSQLEQRSAQELESLEREAQARAREIIVEAKDEALATKIKADKEAQAILHQAEEQQRDLTIKIDRIDQKLSQLDQKEATIDRQQKQIETESQELQKNRQEVVKKLEEVGNFTQEQAKQELKAETEKKITGELAQIIRERQEAAQSEVNEKAKEILVDAMKYAATDYVAEYTSSTVTLPSEDIKGKIIGKSGRNIHSFEMATGVDVDLDVSPTEIKISSFDSVRREIARVSMEKLIKDGRIQPARIEEIVSRTSKEINRIMFDEGKKLCHTVGVYNLPNELMQMLGRYKYRFSYGQSLIAHTLEVTRVGTKIAHELGLNVATVKLGCLLHDIGKVSEEVEGSHVELGVKILKRFNIDPAVIKTVAEHHEDEEFSSFESIAVYMADAISGARPGARYENYDEYVQRLQKLEEIANSYPEVQKSYAIQAGREIRVLLEPAKSKDDDVLVLAERIRDQIKAEMSYPGTVTVTVIREERGQATAN